MGDLHGRPSRDSTLESIDGFSTPVLRAGARQNSNPGPSSHMKENASPTSEARIVSRVSAVLKRLNIELRKKLVELRDG